MLQPQYLLPISDELVIDLFAGGGGASTGIEEAIGRPVDIAINHNIEAVAMHMANHPQTKHYVSDVFEVDPVEVCEGRPVGMLWTRTSRFRTVEAARAKAEELNVEADLLTCLEVAPEPGNRPGHIAYCAKRLVRDCGWPQRKAQAQCEQWAASFAGSPA